MRLPSARSFGQSIPNPNQDRLGFPEPHPPGLDARAPSKEAGCREARRQALRDLSQLRSLTLGLNQKLAAGEWTEARKLTSRIEKAARRLRAELVG